MSHIGVSRLFSSSIVNRLAYALRKLCTWNATKCLVCVVERKRAENKAEINKWVRFVFRAETDCEFIDIHFTSSIARIMDGKCTQHSTNTGCHHLGAVRHHHPAIVFNIHFVYVIRRETEDRKENAYRLRFWQWADGDRDVGTYRTHSNFKFITCGMNEWASERPNAMVQLRARAYHSRCQAYAFLERTQKSRSF